MKLMTHWVLGYPDQDQTVEAVKRFIEVGVDYIELQIPFSDPMADGPTIMEANRVALAGGSTVKKSIELIAKTSKLIESSGKDIEIVVMTYANILLSSNYEKLVSSLSTAGCSYLIVPDVSIDTDEGQHIHKLCKEKGMHFISVLSPASNLKRIKINLEDASGFVYFGGRKGVTGAKDSLGDDLEKSIAVLKNHTDIPLGIGWGISKREHISELEKIGFDIAIVGSALIDSYNSGGLEGLEKKLTQLRGA